MSQSPLVTRQWWANPNNYTVGRQGSNLWGIVIHHAASTSLDSVGYTFANPSRQASAHYGVKGNQIHQYVAEENGAWHCGDYWGNMGTIGIETVNSTGAPNWLVDDETFETLARLVADIAKRNGLGKLKFEPDGYCPNLSAHRDWSATGCPGDYLYGKMYELAERANNINYPPAPSVVWHDNPYPVMVTNKATNLIELPSLKVIKSYPAGEKIESLCQYAIVSGKAYLRTEYSKINNKNNGFLEVDLSVYEEPKPEPEPTPEPTPDPEPTPEPEPEPTPDPEPAPVDDTPNWFIRFIQALGEFFTNLFKKK